MACLQKDYQCIIRKTGLFPVSFVNRITIALCFLLALCFSLPANAQQNDVPVTDVEGNTYQTIKYGDQIWMGENLRTETYNDGTAIPSDQYWWYDDDKTAAIAGQMGALYSYYTVETHNVCPVGWHVPTREEFSKLLNFLADNGYNYDGTTGGGGKKLARSMADNAANWTSPLFVATNTSNFAAQPAGYLKDGVFSNKGKAAFWRTNTPYIRYFDNELAQEKYQIKGSYVFELSGTGDSPVGDYLEHHTAGVAIRCIKNSSDWVTDMQIKSMPAKTNYVQGEHLSYSGLIITLTYEDTSTKDLVYSDFENFGITCSRADGLALSGDQEIEITHTETNRTVTIPITVAANNSRYGLVADSEGNTYKTITIGNQEWMAENLRATKYNDGTALQEVTADATWVNTTSPAYSWMEYDRNYAETYTYGTHYNYYVIENGEVCPAGWTVPTEKDWKTLIAYLSDNNYSYTGNKNESFGNGLGKALAIETGAWKAGGLSIGDIGYLQNTNNSSGFSAIPAEYKSPGSGTLSDSKQDAYWWTSSNGICYHLGYGYSGITGTSMGNKAGVPIRCIKETDDRVVSISIINAPDITSYNTGEILDLTGLEVKLTRKNGNAEIVKYEDFTTDEFRLTPTAGKPVTAAISTINIKYWPSAVETDFAISVVDNFSQGAVSDVDGNTYQTITIGNQEWMSENLRTTTLNDGTAIDNITDYTQWDNSTGPAYCWFDNNSLNKNSYGALYNAYTIETEKLCPAGWHVPVQDEWKQLFEYLDNNNYSYDGSTGNSPASAKKGKALASRHIWQTNSASGMVGNNLSLNNTTGFNAVPAGYRQSPKSYFSPFNDEKEATYFYSGTKSGGKYLAYKLHYYSENIETISSYMQEGGFSHSMQNGCSVRCIKGELNGGVTFKVSGGYNRVLTFNGKKYQIPYTGELTIPKIIDGTYNYSVSAFKYETEQGTVTVNNAIEVVNISMTPAPVYSITFNFTDENGNTITDRVSLYSEGSGYVMNPSTTSGKIVISGMPDMNFPYEILSEKYVNVTDSVTVSGSNAVVNVVLKKAPAVYVIAFEIRDYNTNAAINNASVNLDGTNYAGTNGIVRVPGLTDDNDYDFTIEAPGYRSTSKTITLNGASTMWTIKLAEAKYNVTFNIKDQNGNVINNADITIDGTTYSATNGTTTITGLPDGSYSYTINSTGFRDKQGTISTSDAGDTIEITMTSNIEPVYSAVINIKDNSGNTINNASLTCDGQRYSTTNGVITVSDLANGIYSFTVSAVNFVSKSGTITINGSDISQTIKLTPDYSITFKMWDEAGDTIKNVEVTLYNMGTHTTTNGTVKFSGVKPSGVYVYTIKTAGYHAKSGTVTMKGDHRTLNITLISSSISINDLTFNVTDTDGNPLIYSYITFNGTKYQVTTGGKRILNDIKDGYYNYEVTCTGYESQSGSVILNGSDKTLNIVLQDPPKYNLSFSVKDKNGNPIEAAVITFRYTDYSTTGGIATIGSFTKGTYSYTVKASGYNTQSGTLTLTSDTQKEIVLDELPSVTFVITDINGNPLPGVEVYWNRYSNTPTGISDAGGQVTINNIEDGKYEYDIYLDGYDYIVDYATIAGAGQTINLTLDYLKVSFVVKDTDGNPLPNATVNIYGIDYYTNASGCLTISNSHSKYGYHYYKVTYPNYSAEYKQATINGNTTINVTLTRINTTDFTVTFYDWDGSMLKQETVASGNSATAPADPVRSGYTFTGWDTDFGNVVADLIVTAQYSVATSISETENKDKVIIHPNPVKDVLIIDTQGIINKGELVTIMDITGKVVYSKPVTKIVESVDVAGLDKGVYFVKIGLFIQKFIKE
jgi:uncharacterized protein (TIGR02145 family)